MSEGKHSNHAQLSVYTEFENKTAAYVYPTSVFFFLKEACFENHLSVCVEQFARDSTDTSSPIFLFDRVETNERRNIEG